MTDALEVVMMYHVKAALEGMLSLTGIHLQKLKIASERYVLIYVESYK